MAEKSPIEKGHVLLLKNAVDKRLEQRWQTGKLPFDGPCLRLMDHVELPTLRLLLRTMVNVLHEHKNDRRLFRFDDWHEHDGYVTETHAADWEALDQILLNDQTLQHSRHGDTYVRRAYYPDDLTFLLRYDVLDPDEERELSEPQGDCDLCADANIIREVSSKAQLIVDCLEVGNAKEYFDEIYAG